MDNGQEQVIAYFSHTSTQPEQNYRVTRKELLAVVKSIKPLLQVSVGPEICAEDRSFHI